MGEVKVGKQTGHIGCHGLGSCVGLIAYDCSSLIGAIAHVVLPDSTGRPNAIPPGKYMDQAVATLSDEIFKSGGSITRLRFAAVGGANVFKYGVGASSLNLEIGARNAAALRKSFQERRIRLEGELLGGTTAMSTYLCLETGRVFVATNGKEFEVLCHFAGGAFVRAA
jgi:chemotaxis protein CheD